MERLDRLREARLRQIARLGPFLAVSLVRARWRCGRPTCRCVQGEKHASWFLTRLRNGKTQTTYVRHGQLREVQRWVERYKRLKGLIREVTELSLRVLKAQPKPVRHGRR